MFMCVSILFYTISVAFLVGEVLVTETRAANLSPIQGEDAEIIRNLSVERS